MRLLPTLLLLVSAVSVPGNSEGRTVTCYLDAAVVEYDVTARKGTAAFVLPPGASPGSLRIKPEGRFDIVRVDTSVIRPGGKTAKEIETLEQRKNLLNDRLKALETKEEIFKAAAKSQSGRAIRKSKNNPNPLSNMSQGTDFAISHLEGVYSSRRKLVRDLNSVEQRLSELGKREEAGGTACTVRVSAGAGRIHVAYLLPGRGWRPSYDFRLEGPTTLKVSMRAELAHGVPDGALSVVSATAAEGSTGPGSLPVSGNGGIVREFVLPVEKLEVSGILRSLSFSFKNVTGSNLPPGEAICYWKGEYLGKSGFTECKKDEIGSLSFGK